MSYRLWRLTFNIVIGSTQAMLGRTGEHVERMFGYVDLEGLVWMERGRTSFFSHLYLFPDMRRKERGGFSYVCLSGFESGRVDRERVRVFFQSSHK